MSARYIGGFFGLEPAATTPSRNVLSLWDIPARPHTLFRSARAALRALYEALNPPTVWLPAYSCAALAQAAKGGPWMVRFFPLCEDLSPDLKRLEASLRSGDAVLAIDYFGRHPSPEFLAFAAARTDIHWIEDRAQALWPGAAPWGHSVLYSPRKLLGVPEGGILVGHALPPPREEALPAVLLAPAQLRAEDKAETNNAAWYRAHQAREAMLDTQPVAMSGLTREILARTDPAPLMAARHNNCRVLAQELAALALLPPDEDAVPFGFPIRVPQRERLAASLHAQGIFAAHHWPELPSPRDEFPFEHVLSAQLLTLPVDHRYDSDDMRRVAKAVREAL